MVDEKKELKGVRLAGVELRSVVAKGKRTNSYSYLFRQGDDNKWYMSCFNKDYIQLLGEQVDVVYVERPNPNNVEYPYKNIQSVTKAQAEVGVGGDLLAGSDPEPPTQAEQELLQVLEQKPLELVTKPAFFATLKKHLVGVDDARVGVLWTFWCIKHGKQ